MTSERHQAEKFNHETTAGLGFAPETRCRSARLRAVPHRWCPVPQFLETKFMTKEVSVEDLDQALSLSGWYIPRRVVHLFQLGKVNKSEMLLLATVYAYVKKGQHKSCFVSNATIAKHLRCGVSSARGLIYSLTGKGFLVVSIDKINGTNKSARHLKCVVKQLERPCQKFDTSPVKNLTHNKQYYIKGRNAKAFPPPANRSAVRRGARNRIFKSSGELSPTNGHSKLTSVLPSLSKLDQLFEDDDEATTKADEAQADRFYDILIKHEVIKKCSNVHVRTWSKWLKRIAKNRSQKYLDSVIDFFDKHGGDKYCPKPRNAKQLYDRFKNGQIDAAMKREEIKNPTVKISKEAKTIAKRLANFKWPRGSAEQLPKAVQLSLTAYKRFRTAANDITGSRESKRLARWMLSNFGAPSEFVHQWFEDVFEQRSDWDKWDGYLLRDVFTLESDKFKKTCMSLCLDYCGDGRKWIPVLEKLKNGKPN